MKKKNNQIEITIRTKGNPPLGELPFVEIVRTILREEYQLSLVFIDDEESTEINKKWRKF